MLAEAGKIASSKTAGLSVPWCQGDAAATATRKMTAKGRSEDTLNAAEELDRLRDLRAVAELFGPPSRARA